MDEATMLSDGDEAEIISRIMVEMEEVFALIRGPAGAAAGARTRDCEIERGPDRAALPELN